MTRSTTTVVIGAGQAGLAMSACLTGASVDHVLLERGRVAGAWSTQRWDSLRLLSPNWMTRLPRYRYRGPDPDGFMTAAEVAAFLERYCGVIGAPVHTGITVTGVSPRDCGFDIETDQGPWSARTVVVASGACGTPRIPAVSEEVPRHIKQLSPIRYRNPDQVGDGRVLVVGASSSGVQIADELARSGRDVTIAVGDHTRVPRRYRGRDIHWWMDVVGLYDDRIGEMEDPDRARRLPSLQLVGTPEGRTLDLNSLMDLGVALVGRLVGISGSVAQFSGSLANFSLAADLKEVRLLDQIDEFATEAGLDGDVGEPWRPARTRVPQCRTTLDMSSFATIVWATGYRYHYPWMDPALLDPKGRIDHIEGVGGVPGLYVMGLPFMRRRKSPFLDGVGDDAAELTEHLMGHLAGHSMASDDMVATLG